VTIAGTTTAILRLSPALAAAIDAWAESAKVSRSEAMRRLVERGLAYKAKPKAAK
jgi:hypothetical protein